MRNFSQFCVLLFSGFLFAVPNVLSAQSLTPLPGYNPDSDASGTIQTPDLMDLLTVFGSEFEPMGCAHPQPLAEVAELQQQVETLQGQLEAQQELLNRVVGYLQSQPTDGPFKFDAAQGAWVATSPIVIENTVHATRVRTGRLESGSAHFGGSVVVGDPED